MSIAEAAEVHDVQVRLGRHVGVGGLLTVVVVPGANAPKYQFCVNLDLEK